MQINWFGHSCFKIAGKQTAVVTDPYAPDLGYSLGSPTAHIVTVSHDHPGHAHVQGVGDAPKMVTGPGEYEIAGVLIVGIASYHDAEGGKTRGTNTVYVIEIDDIAVCHLGDLGHILTASQVEEIDHVDVLLVPVGGVSTINAPMAAEVVRQLEPKVVIPMHYKTRALRRELEPVDRFLSEIGVKEVGSQPKLSLTKTSLPETAQVVLLDYEE